MVDSKHLPATQAADADDLEWGENQRIEDRARTLVAFPLPEWSVLTSTSQNAHIPRALKDRQIREVEAFYQALGAITALRQLLTAGASEDSAARPGQPAVRLATGGIAQTELLKAAQQNAHALDTLAVIAFRHGQIAHEFGSPVNYPDRKTLMQRLGGGMRRISGRARDFVLGRFHQD